MKIGITSQNFRTITGHGGKSRRFLVYQIEESGEIKEDERIDLPMGMAMHDFRGPQHPLFDLDVLVTGSCGAGFAQRMAQHQVQVIATGETDPMAAVKALANKEPLPAPQPHEHNH
jgi:predicted Fe-Mo cluster-binding NifX family protein